MCERDDPHTKRYPQDAAPAWEVVYWRGGVASGARGATRCQLRQFAAGCGWNELGTFDLHSQEFQLSRWLLALHRAHKAGQAAKAADSSQGFGDVK